MCKRRNERENTEDTCAGMWTCDTLYRYQWCFRADACDGLLDIIMFKAVQIYELLPLFIKVFKGEHLDSNKVLYFKTDYLKVECHEDIVTDIDGEKGPDFPLEIKCIKGGLKILGAK